MKVMARSARRLICVYAIRAIRMLRVLRQVLVHIIVNVKTGSLAMAGNVMNKIYVLLAHVIPMLLVRKLDLDYLVVLVRKDTLGTANLVKRSTPVV
jgi:hypothetical protein